MTTEVIRYRGINFDARFYAILKEYKTVKLMVKGIKGQTYAYDNTNILNGEVVNHANHFPWLNYNSLFYRIHAESFSRGIATGQLFPEGAETLAYHLATATAMYNSYLRREGKKEPKASKAHKETRAII